MLIKFEDKLLDMNTHVYRISVDLNKARSINSCNANKKYIASKEKVIGNILETYK